MLLLQNRQYPPTIPGIPGMISGACLLLIADYRVRMRLRPPLIDFLLISVSQTRQEVFEKDGKLACQTQGRWSICQNLLGSTTNLKELTVTAFGIVQRGRFRRLRRVRG